MRIPSFLENHMIFFKSCKIIADSDWGQYYHFTYGTFPKGTEVPVFERELSTDESVALDQANESLSHYQARATRQSSGEQRVSKSVTVSAGKMRRLELSMDHGPSPEFG